MQEKKISDKKTLINIYSERQNIVFLDIIGGGLQTVGDIQNSTDASPLQPAEFGPQQVLTHSIY